jgi:hypothetical protein
MKKPELETILKKARLPEIAEKSLEAFPRQVIARLKSANPPNHQKQEFFPRWAWGFGLAACVVIAFATARWPGRVATSAIAPTDRLASAKLIHELMTMFPNRLRAIVQDQRGLNLFLSDTNNVAASPPLYIRIWDGAHSASFVTFSGQEIQVDGQTITALADVRGGIILTGNQFVWSSTKTSYLDSRMKIEAKTL